MDEILVDRLRDSDKIRRRKSDVQGKLYNFLNRSAQSLSRSNSQSGRSRREKDKDTTDASDRDITRAGLHATSSRLPAIDTGNALETSTSTTGQTKLPSSTRTSRSGTATPGQPRKSSSPPLTPLGQHKHSLSGAPQSYTYNTPPQTPSRSRKYSNPSSPSSITSGRNLLLNRPLARPITPSNSATSKKVFGITIPSPTLRKAALEVEGTPERRTHKSRTGSDSSNEPLLNDRSLSNENGQTIPRQPSVNASTPTPTTPRVNRTSKDRTPLPTPQSSLPRSYRSTVSREEPPASPTPSSRRGTPRLDFWRSITPRAPSAQGNNEKEKRTQRAATPEVSRKQNQIDQSGAGLVSPQPRTPGATFLPRFHRTPATPQRAQGPEVPNTVRLDSFMSDSLPIQQSDLQSPQSKEQSRLARQPAFTQTNVPRMPRTPAPERQPTQATLGIQRSKSTPGTRGRLSPCLRIPSPKFLTRERSRSKELDKEKEKDREKGMLSEKRRVAPENVSAPIVRETRTHLHTHPHGIGTRIGSGAGGGEKVALKAAKSSLVQLRRAAHGTFDFERPGSRTSSKSGQSESMGTRSDDEREKDQDKVNDNDSDVRRIMTGRSPKSPEPVRAKLKSPSPVPPLPTSTRLKPQSPPPAGTRARSPLSTHPGPSSHQSHSHAHSHIDDSALPRLSSSSARRNSSSNQHFRTPGYGTGYRSPASLPHFSFEPAARGPSPPVVPPKPVREGGGQYVDTRTGLIMYAPKTCTSPIPRSPEGGRRVTITEPGAPVNGHANPAATKIPQRELEEATAVITQFKNALNEAGFATLQKYVRRYDAKIIPLDGAAGLLIRVQRLLDTSAPRVDERRKRQLYESFVRVVRVSQVS